MFGHHREPLRTVTRARRNSAPYSGLRPALAAPAYLASDLGGGAVLAGRGVLDVVRRSTVPRLGTAPGYSSESCVRPRATALAKDCMPEKTLNDTAHRDSFGSVEGAVEKLAQDHAAKFAVYPDEASRGVPCYLSDKDEAKMARLRRKRVRVEGLLRRDSSTSRPLSIRAVTNIEVLEPPATNPQDLWGILPTAGDRKPEEIIRAAWDNI